MHRQEDSAAPGDLRPAVSGPPAPPPSSLSAAVASCVADLSPGAFGFVMAGGIVSLALAGRGPHALSAALALIAGAGYVLLWAATAARLVRWRHRFLADLAGPGGFAVLAVAAASAVLADRLIADRMYGAAEALTVLGAAVWLLLGYTVPVLLIRAGRARSLGQVNGTWFMWVVGTQSVAVATASLGQHAAGRPLAALASVCWAVGLVQYLLIAALALARLLLVSVAPAELAPPYWVFMGAAAISVLAGAELLRLPAADALLPRSFVLGLSLVLWSFCTWLIPLLLALGVWRHVLRRVPLRYESGLWSLVFPVGMYGVATRALGRAGGWHWMAAIGSDEAWVALAVWTAAFTGMLVTAARTLRSVRARHDPPGRARCRA